MHIAPMLRLRLEDDSDSAMLCDLAEEVVDIRATRGERAANEHLIRRIGVTTRAERDEAYYCAATEYHLGLLHAALRQPERAAKCFARSGTLAHSGAPLLYSDQVAESMILRERQMRAVERGVPAIVIASMPRAASASLTQTISASHDIPIMRVSAGRFPHDTLVPRWLEHFLTGGAVLHDHFSADEFNLRTLRDLGIGRLFVLVRDPKAAAISYAKWTDCDFGDAMERYNVWLAGWRDALGLQIDWIKYEDIAAGRAMEKIIAARPDLREHGKNVSPVIANMTNQPGNTDRYRATGRYLESCRDHEIIAATLKS